MQRLTLTAGASTAEIVPARGGIVTRFDNVLYLDESTLLDPTKSVRGGVPILFPCAGKADGLPFPLRQHGFARNLPFAVTSVTANAAKLELTTTPATKAIFPFDFRLELEATLAPHDLTLTYTIENQDEKPMPIHFGLHPYFQVADKARFTVDTPQVTQAFDNTTSQTIPYQHPNFDNGEIDLHFPFDEPTTTLKAPHQPNVRLSWTPNFQALILWTQPAKPFVCVEPWSSLTGELKNPRHLLQPGQSEAFTFRMQAE